MGKKGAKGVVRGEGDGTVDITFTLPVNHHGLSIGDQVLGRLLSGIPNKITARMVCWLP